MTGYSAIRLPRHRGPAAWDVILGDRAPLPALDGDMTADVAVIGGGFAGLSAARRLMQLDPALRVVVLEAGRIAEGAAGRNSGFMIDLPHELTSEDYAGAGDDRQIVALNRRAIAFAGDAVAEYGIDPAFFDPAGKTNGAASEAAMAQNASYAQHLDELGEAYELLDARAMEAMTGSRHYLGGLYTPGTVMLQPAGYVRGLAAGLSGTVRICEGSPVTGFARDGAGWRVTTPKGDVSAGKIILANNGHLESFGLKRGRLMHLFLFARMTARLDARALARLGGHPRWGITPSDPMGTTMRRIDGPQGGPRIVTRTCAAYEPGMESSAGQMARAARVMRGKFDDRFPQLAGAPMEHVWAGHLCLTRNGVSVCQEVDTGVFTACAQNGLGTARGTLTGIAAAEMALARPSEIAAHFAAAAEPVRLPPAPIARLGATAVLRLKEWRARAD